MSEFETNPLSSADAKEGVCTRCGEAGRVWPVEQPADIVLELEWGYARLCLDCWRDLGEFFNTGETDSDPDPPSGGGPA